MTRICILALAGILSIISADRAAGAELYGTFTANNSNIFRGARVEVNCGDWGKTMPVAGSGKMNLRGIPDGRGCYLTVHHPDYKQSPRCSLIQVKAWSHLTQS